MTYTKDLEVNTNLLKSMQILMKLYCMQNIKQCNKLMKRDWINYKDKLIISKKNTKKRLYKNINDLVWNEAINRLFNRSWKIANKKIKCLYESMNISLGIDLLHCFLFPFIIPFLSASIINICITSISFLTR